MTCPFTLADVLAVTHIHPFYSNHVKYPPDFDTIREARKQAATKATEPCLKSQSVLWKSDLYKTITRLVEDTCPQNTFRQRVYTSITGGGTGGKPLFFATDVQENRQARKEFAGLIRCMGLVTDSDWVVTTHSAGKLYRSLDLMSELFENAGASVLAAGQYMPPSRVIQLMIDYHANVLSGESGQIVSIVHYISTLPEEKRNKIKLEKIIYTSESLTLSQRSYILYVLDEVKIYSILGSAEAGPYAVSCPQLTGDDWGSTSHQDFVFDARMTRIEIVPLSLTAEDSNPEPIEDGRKGSILQTSLTRLRNPLVRYVTGDVGSLHPLPEAVKEMVPETDRDQFHILRLEGRDRRFSFEWDGNYFEFSKLSAMMNNPHTGVLQWLVVLDTRNVAKEKILEVRILASDSDPLVLSQKDLVENIEIFFQIGPENAARFKVVFLADDAAFVRSATGGKVIKFVNNHD